WLFSSNGPKAKIALNGAGATFPCPLITAWSSQYVNVTRAPTTPGPQVTVNYNCVGSGAGITQITSKTVDFAGTDAPLKPSERARAPNLLHIPETIGAVTASYNVVEFSTGIKLSGYTLAEIFRGTITQWNSPNISADNTGITLPARRPRPPRRPWRVRRAPEATGPTCRSWISQGPRATRSRP